MRLQAIEEILLKIIIIINKIICSGIELYSELASYKAKRERAQRKGRMRQQGYS